MRSMRRVGPACLALALLGGCVGMPAGPGAGVESGQATPEAGSGYIPKTAVATRKSMVVAANPLATHAGLTILQAGGSAVDAAIAVQMVLALVEPQSSGLGGGAFMLHFDGKAVTAFDGRETAPAAVDARLFLQPDGKPLPFFEAVVGGRAVGVPGLLRMLEMAHRQHGKLPWRSLFAPAIALAEKGFRISPRLAKLLGGESYLARDAEAAAYFYDADGAPWPAGHLLKNPALAATLRAIAEDGADAFYTGQIAQAMVARVAAHRTAPGRLAMADLAGYHAVQRAPLCFDYKAWSVCGMPPPSSAGIAIAQMLGILSHQKLATLAPTEGRLDSRGVHLFAEAGRLAYADRARYVADTDFVALPGGSTDALLDKSYLGARAALIGERSMGTATAGAPLGIKLARGLDRSPELQSTSHLSIVDEAGHAVSMTSSIENAFGSRIMVGGFLLNNQLTDFSFAPEDADGPVANRVAPGKRPRSAMAPTIVLERRTGELVLAIGSPGGPATINYVAKVLVGVLDWNLTIQEAIDLPNFGSRNGPTELERSRVSPELVEQLRARGHVIRLGEYTSGLHGFMRKNIDGEQRWLGGADPRREGSVEGE